jgi:hypothetical protein
MNRAVKGTRMIKKMPKEQRQKRRGSISVPISYSSVTEEQGQKESSEGRTADYGESGLGIYAHKELKKGSTLEIECPDIWETPRKFTVQWCNRVSNNFFRVGLSLE